MVRPPTNGEKFHKSWRGTRKKNCKKIATTHKSLFYYRKLLKTGGFNILSALLGLYFMKPCLHPDVRLACVRVCVSSTRIFGRPEKAYCNNWIHLPLPPPSHPYPFSPPGQQVPPSPPSLRAEKLNYYKPPSLLVTVPISLASIGRKGAKGWFRWLSPQALSGQTLWTVLIPPPSVLYISKSHRPTHVQGIQILLLCEIKKPVDGTPISIIYFVLFFSLRVSSTRRCPPRPPPARRRACWWPSARPGAASPPALRRTRRWCPEKTRKTKVCSFP